MPRFDSSNPRLWQSRCKDYFALWGTPAHLWIQYASSQFEGAAARWLESVQRRALRATWSDFCQLLQSRFGRNQHQLRIHKFFQIAQQSAVVDYVEPFSELYDHLTTYEASPDPLHYLTRFQEGLNPDVRRSIAMQKAKDLDATYELALLHEELGEIYVPTPVHSYTKKIAPVPSVSSAKSVISETKSTPVTTPTHTVDDKWAALRAYRKSKGLCFICGEKWSRDHQCKSSVQLHFVQELIDQLDSGSTSSSYDDDSPTNDHVMSISNAAIGTKTSVHTIQLTVRL